MDAKMIKNAIPKDNEIEDVSFLFKILGDPTRSKILFILEKGPLCVNEICECIEMTPSAVSHQLRTLKQAKLVKSKKIGKEVFYSLDDEHVSEIFNCALVHIRE